MLIDVVLNKQASHFNPAVVSLCQILFVIIGIVLGNVYVHIILADIFFSLFLAVLVVPWIYMFMDKNVVSFFFKFVCWFDYCCSKIDYLMS